MAVQGSNDEIAQLLKQACPPVAASPEFKAKLRQRLNEQAGALGTESPKPLWQQPFFWIPTAAASAVALALIIYFVVFHSVPLAVTTSDATGIQTTAATLNGKLDSLGTADSVDVSFEWGVSTDYGNETTPESRTAAGSVQVDLGGLAPNTEYHFRIKAVGHDGAVYGPDQQFTTGAAPPLATTSDAAKIRPTSATLTGSLDDLGSAASVSVSFEWGLTTSYGNETTPESQTTSGKYSADLDGLTPNTTYHFRAKAVAGGAAVYGADVQFSTGATPPSVATSGATNITTNSGQLNGALSSLGTAGRVSVSFEWGLTKSYGKETTPESKTATGEYGAPLSGLSPNTTYHFRAKAVGHGTIYGADRQFTTGTTAPSVATSNATNISTGSARLNGELTSLGTAGSATVSFVWGTASGGPYDHETTREVTGIGAFSSALDGLDAGITYYYKAKAVGHGDPVYGVEKSFTTLTEPPSVSTSSATEIHTRAATLDGSLDSLGTADSVSVCFEWGLTVDYANETPLQELTATGSFNATLPDLLPATTYHFRAKAVGDGVAYGADMTFTTGNTPPAQKTWYLSKDASGSVKAMYDGDTSKPTGTVTLYSRGSSSSQIWMADQPSLAGTVYTAGIWDVRLLLSHVRSTHTIYVEIGTWDGIDDFVAYGNHTFLGQGKDDSIVYKYEDGISVDSFDVPSGSYVATRLTVSAQHMVYVQVGGSQSYVASPVYPEPTAPSVTTNTATSVELTTATLNGYLDSLGTASSVRVCFEWGLTADYGNEIEVGPQASGGSFSTVLANLIPNASYHFRAKAVGDGTNYGVDTVFTTPP